MSKVVSGKSIGIVAGGPKSLLAHLADFEENIDYWIGCDRGALYLIDHELPVDLAVGDFDSVDQVEFKQIEAYASKTTVFPVEKDLTDLELAINEAKKLKVAKLYLFGVTGGRKDHELASIFMLEKLVDQPYSAQIVDQLNQLTVYRPGKHQIERTIDFPNISLLSLSEQVTGLNLTNFYYSLKDANVKRGDSLTISNYLIEQTGHFSFESGILIVIKSVD